MDTSTGEEREHTLAAQGATVRGRVPADTFANRLILARALAGHLSIREAADLCKPLGRGAWTNWERGARPADLLETARIISEKLDVDFDWLLFGGPLDGPRGRPILRRIEHADGAPYVRPHGGRPKNYPGPSGPVEAGRRPKRRAAVESGRESLVPVTLRGGVSHNE
jgi:hypothetical protein